MKVDRNKILQKAQAYVQKNQLDKAIAEYEVLIRADPTDVSSVLRLAGLYLRVDKPAQAVEAYVKAGDRYNKTGFYQKALAAFKQAVQLDPSSPALLQQVGEVYLSMNMKGQAIDNFAKAGDLYARAGKSAEALAMMTRVVEAEPGRPDYKAKYGEMLYQAGRHDESLAVFSGLVELLKLEGQWEELARFYERILQLFPSETAFGLDLARVYLRLGIAPKAQQRLKMVYDAGERSAEVFDLLARSYALLGKNDRAVGAYVEKVRRLEAAGDHEEIPKTWRRVLEIDPTNEHALRALGDADSTAAAAVESVPKRRDSRTSGRDISVAEVVVAERGPTKTPGPAATAGSNSELSGILQEASIYVRFGIPEKAVRKIDQILARDPNNVPALHKRVELIKAARPGDAVVDLLHLAEIYEGLGNMKASDDAVAAAKKIDSKHPRLLEFLGELPVEQAAAGTAKVAAKAAVADVVELSDDSEVVFPDADEFVGGDDHTEVDLQALADDAVELDVDVDIEAGDDADALSDEVAGSASLGEPPAWQAEIDEVHFYIDTEHFGEARAILGELRRRFGDDPVFAELEARIPDAQKGAPAGAAKPTKERPAAAVPPPAPAGGAMFDLARELDMDDELSFGGVEVAPGAEDVPDFEEIFDAFKKGVKEQLGDDDADAHYDLGIAYMEMGLFDDAVSEFEIARSSPAKAAEAYYMAAVALTRKGEPQAAIEYYREGLKTPDLAQGMKLNLNYELAMALDEVGDMRSALQHFKAVLEIDRNYREVAKCLKAIREKLEAKKGAGTPSGGAPSNVTYL